MPESQHAGFRVGDRVRYTGEVQPEGDLLARGLVGLVIEGPPGGPGAPRPRRYRVMFGGRPVWVGADRLDWD